MPAITRHKIYEAYRKLKNYFYYDNTSLTIRYKTAEFEQQFYTEPNLDFEQRFKVAMESVYKIVNGEDRGNRLLNTLLSQINFTYITKSVEKPGDERIVVCLSLATSWSHKYEELFRDYNITDSVLPLDDFNKAKKKVRRLLDNETNTQIRKNLQIQVSKIKEQTCEMWNEIWNL